MAELVEVRAYDRSGAGAYVVIPRREGLSFLVDLNDTGSGSLTVRSDDPVLAAHPGLLAYGNVVKFAWVGGAEFAAFKIRNREATVAVDDPTLAVSGPGLLASLEEATVFPYAGITRTSSDSRYFGWMSATGDWFDSLEWRNPLSIVQQAGHGNPKAGYPLNWPDPLARWIYPDPGPAYPVAPGRCLMRTTFTLAEAETVKFSVTADDALRLYLDEQLILDSLEFNFSWQHTYTYTAELNAGEHVIGAEVTNAERKHVETNVSALLLSGAIVDPSGTGTVVVRSNGAWWTYVVDPALPNSTPGMSAAAVLIELFGEAQARGVDSLLGVEVGFTGVHDSSGQPWPDRQERSFVVGTDLANVVEQLSELAFDVELNPGDMTLRAYQHQGADKSATIWLIPGKNLRAYSWKEGGATPRSQVLLRSAGGWSESINPAAVATVGRIEGFISTGLSVSTEQATRVSDAVLPKLSQTEITATAQMIATAGARPLIDFTVGDTIMGLDETGGPLALDVGSISAEPDETGAGLVWSLELIRP